MEGGTNMKKNNDMTNGENRVPWILSEADNVQKNVFNSSDDINQALRLSDQDNHNKRIDNILNNPNLSEEEKTELFDHEMNCHRQRIEQGMADIEHDHRNRANCIIEVLKTFSNFLFNVTVFLFLITPEKDKRTMLP